MNRVCASAVQSAPSTTQQRRDPSTSASWRAPASANEHCERTIAAKTFCHNARVSASCVHREPAVAHREHRERHPRHDAPAPAPAPGDLDHRKARHQQRESQRRPAARSPIRRARHAFARSLGSNAARTPESLRSPANRSRRWPPARRRRTRPSEARAAHRSAPAPVPSAARAIAAPRRITTQRARRCHERSSEHDLHRRQRRATCRTAPRSRTGATAT